MNILESLAESNKKLIKEKQKTVPVEDLKKQVKKLSSKPVSFKKALDQDKVAFICELKKASPSKGLINPEFNYLQILNEYEENGAEAISCLTEPTKFLGSLEILEDVTDHATIPVLRKDFITDPYQIYEARLAGASAVLLIAALLDQETLKNLLDLTHSLDMDALVEVHNEQELDKGMTRF